ncbi:MAG: AAA family ATPase [Candidatus Lokiarchaeota archaeon]|nr:AAA family ATPase [Candidatus Lokiarchaeota archaeon]MBD3340419.1 AAA family ATPase [Candidatus Lokiarchaeota archaeon]
MESNKILIIGPPECGKSTLIEKLIDYYTDRGISVEGFMTPEIREKKKRVGFYVELIPSKMRFKLARIGDYNQPHRIGKYSVFIDDFNRALKMLGNLNKKKANIVLIDEIGKMELFSIRFQEYVETLFQSERNVIATIGKNFNHPIKNYLLTLREVVLFELSHNTFHNISNKIILKVPNNNN